MEKQIYSRKEHFFKCKFENSKFYSGENRQKTYHSLRVLENGKLFQWDLLGENPDFENLLIQCQPLLSSGKTVDYLFPNPSTKNPTPFPETPFLDSLDFNKAKKIGNQIVETVSTRLPGLSTNLELQNGKFQGEIQHPNGKKVTYGYPEFKFSMLFSSCEQEDIFFWGQEFPGIPHTEKELFDFSESCLTYLQLCENRVDLPPGSYPVIFPPEIISTQLLKVLEQGYSPLILEKGLSPLSNSTNPTHPGQKISLSPKITLTNNPQFIPFDLDGIPTTPLTFISKGVVESLPIQLRSSEKLKQPPNGSRHLEGFSAGCSLMGGTRSFKDLIKGIKRGIFVAMAGDLFMGNILHGDMNGTLQLGFLIENGELVGRLKGGFLNFNLFKILGEQLIDLSSEVQSFGTGNPVSLPFLFCDNIQYH